MSSLNLNSKSDFITAIFNKYRHSMQRVASRILKDPQSAEDTVSEAMIKIIKNVDILDDIESKKCANFVYTITKNTALDLYRKKQKEDGEKIEVTEEEIVDIDEISANAQARYGSCPYGKAADYTYYAKTTTKNIKLANKIASLTATTLGGVLGYALGIGGVIAGGIAGDILKDAVASDGNILKSKAKVYYHKSKKKFMVTSSIGCQKETTSFYGSNANHILAKKTLWLYNHVNGA